jgi:predicted ATP-grasp superfamily ATP-dependent carboligase
MVAACRSLAQAGYQVSATATTRPAPGQWSRSCTRAFSLPDARYEPEAFLAGLLEILVNSRHSLLLVGSDASLLAVSEHRDVLEPHVLIGLPPHDAVERSLDKLLLGELAHQAGLSAPETILCRGYEQAADAARRFGFPVVVKPRYAVSRFDEMGERPSSRVAWSKAWLARLVPLYGDVCLVQKREPGAVCSCSGIMTGEGLLALAVSRYRRTWPPDGGNGAFSETISPPVALEKAVRPLLAAIGWTGIFELELIWRDDDTFFAIDFNPRPYGSLALAVQAGASLPALWCDWLLGRRPRSVTARPGVRYRWEDGDVRHALWQLRHGDVGGAARTLRPRRGVAHAYFSWRDPAPLVAQIIHLVRGAAARLAQVRTRPSGPPTRVPASGIHRNESPSHRRTAVRSEPGNRRG